MDGLYDLSMGRESDGSKGGKGEAEWISRGGRREWEKEKEKEKGKERKGKERGGVGDRGRDPLTRNTLINNFDITAREEA